MVTESPTVLPYALRAIYLRESLTRLGEGFDPTIANELIGEFRVLGGEAECRTLEINAADGTNKTLRTCVFSTRFEFRYLLAGLPATEKPVVAAEITALITTDYLCNTPDFPLEADLHKWGQSNVLLHAWPYWREFCHSSMVRMQLPVTLIPLAGLTPESGQVQDKPSIPKRTRKKATP